MSERSIAPTILVLLLVCPALGSVGCATGGAAESTDSKGQPESSTNTSEQETEDPEEQPAGSWNDWWGQEVAQSEKVVLTKRQWERAKRLMEIGPIDGSADLTVSEVVAHHLATLPADADLKLEGWKAESTRMAGELDSVLRWTVGGREKSARFTVFYHQEKVQAFDETARAMVREARSLSIPDDSAALPGAYNAAGTRLEERWTGKASDILTAGPKHRDKFRAMDAVLSQKPLVALVTRYATVLQGSSDALERCEADKDCRWRTKNGPEGTMHVAYVMRRTAGDGAARSIGWTVDMTSGELTGRDPVAKAMVTLVDDTLDSEIAPKKQSD